MGQYCGTPIIFAVSPTTVCGTLSKHRSTPSPFGLFVIPSSFSYIYSHIKVVFLLSLFSLPFGMRNAGRPFVFQFLYFL